METILCYKCKSKRATVNTRFFSCIDCFNLYIENNVKKEIRTGPIEKLKRLHCNHELKRPPKPELYVALGFGLTSQALLGLLPVMPKTGKRPDYCIKSFVNVDTSPLTNRDPSEYYECVNSYIQSAYTNNFDTNGCIVVPKLHVIPFCSSFVNGEIQSNREELRRKIVDEIRLLINRGTDHIKLLIQLIILRDIKCYLDIIDSSQQKCLVIASTSESMGSESLQYMTLASGIHIKSMYCCLDYRWPTEESALFLIRPLRNLTLKEVILYWKFNISNKVNCSIGAEVSINKSPIEDEISKFIISQNEKISNISHIFVKLNESSIEQGLANQMGGKTHCTFCGIICNETIMYKYCKMCYFLVKKLDKLKTEK